jgi:sensor domain CHASE-containing protein
MMHVTGWIIIGVFVYIVILIIGLSPFILSSRISRWEEQNREEDEK